MKEKQAAPETVTETRVSTIQYDLVVGPMRFVARLATNDPSQTLKAIWRNEVGTAHYSSGANV